MTDGTFGGKVNDMPLIHDAEYCICGRNYHLAITPEYMSTHIHTDSAFDSQEMTC